MSSIEMNVRKLDPLTDPRWPEFLAQHPASSVFHSAGWLEALRHTYGYEPTVFTTSPQGELSNGVVFCHVRSWLTGNRLVSVPFSDHCQPLASGSDLQAILRFVHSQRRSQGWRYIEVRPRADTGLFEGEPDFEESTAYSFHTIDLRPGLDTIYRGFHESCVRRKIKRADKEKLNFESGNSEQLLNKFRHLLLLTRRRHKLPPQPAAWFRNLVRGLGEQLTVHVLSKEADPIASIITLTHKNSLVYKYGCSDARFHNLGGMSLLFWKLIQRGKEEGALELDLGRSSAEDPGLIAFKGHLGGAASQLKYYRNPALSALKRASASKPPWAREALARMPDPVLAGAGRLLYRHLG
jgi:hypothetical protein